MPRFSLSRAAALASATALTAVSLASCAEDIGPGRYDRFEAGAPARVEEGRVISSRPIVIGNPNTGGATTVGVLSGGAVGSQFGGRGVDRATFGIAGAILGGLAGHAIAEGQQHPGFAYVVRFRDGSTVEIPQADPAPIPDGVRVFVSYGERVRIRPAGDAEPAPTYAGPSRGDYPPPPPPPPPPRY